MCAAWTVGASLLLAPLTAFSLGAISIPSTVAGLSAQATLSGFTDGEGTLIVRGPEGSESEYRTPVRTADGRETTLIIPGASLERSGIYTAQLQSAGTVRGEARFTVSPDRIDLTRSTLSVDRGTIVPDGQDRVTVTAVLADRYGNPLPGRPVELTGVRPGDTIESDTQESDERGRVEFTLRTEQLGMLTLRAIDLLTQQTVSNAVTVQAGGAMQPWNPAMPYPYPMFYGSPYGASLFPPVFAEDPFGIVQGFAINIDPTPLTVDEVASMQIRAVDRSGNTVEDYIGTVRIETPDDPEASLPGFGEGVGEATFTERNRGVKTLSLVLSFRRPGEQRVIVEDTTDPARVVRGETTVTVQGRNSLPDGSRRIAITSHVQDQAIGSPQITLEGTGPALANLIVTGGVADVYDETDAEGRFQVPVTLSGTERDFTIRVRDETGTYDSGSLHLVLDQGLPEIRSMTFTPERPEEHANVLVVVESEPKLSEATLTLGAASIPLFEKPGSPGTYQALFEAPAAGSYQPSLTIRDDADNTATSRSTLVVTPEGLPNVTGVKAEARANGIEVRWNAIPGNDVEAYRVYIAEGQTENFGTAVETDGPATSIVISGLTGGVPYSFAVTAIAGERESREKSPVVQATPLGVRLQVEPMENALRLSWTFDAAMTDQLSAFMLRYGVEEGRATEQRVIDASATTVTLRDLLPGVTYFMELIPFSITGESLPGLAAGGQGTVIGDDTFRPTPSESSPVESKDTPPPSYHGGAPSTTESGGSGILVGMIAAGGVATLVQWQRNRRRRALAQFRALIDRHYRS